MSDDAYPQRARLAHALALAQAVDARAVAEGAAAKGLSGPAIGQALHEARANAIAAGLAASVGG